MNSQSIYNDSDFATEVIPLERNGIKLFFQKFHAKKEHRPDRHILFAHTMTFSSHQHDLNVKDYSLARRLAKAGYCVWALDSAGYGRSQQVSDGYVTDSAYCAQDFAAAMDYILKETGLASIDIAGWSYGTVIAGTYAGKNPGKVRTLILLAPIANGLGQVEVAPFKENPPAGAPEDWQKLPDGQIDYSIVDPAVVELWQANISKYDNHDVPNGGRRELCQDAAKTILPAEGLKLERPVLVLVGSNDDYVSLENVRKMVKRIPGPARLVELPGAGHCAHLEIPFYKKVQEEILAALA
ncbi:MAG: alpha/beta hydrolase [Deltaproteobacteria bacterium]|jgi:pimeloyl-ACP methyl ester carboxylesterase|nr:alpha/beta hydrolase [Deltaproteobacteria bacterium]